MKRGIGLLSGRGSILEDFLDVWIEQEFFFYPGFQYAEMGL